MDALFLEIDVISRLKLCHLVSRCTTKEASMPLLNIDVPLWWECATLETKCSICEKVVLLRSNMYHFRWKSTICQEECQLGGRYTTLEECVPLLAKTVSSWCKCSTCVPGYARVPLDMQHMLWCSQWCSRLYKEAQKLNILKNYSMVCHHDDWCVIMILICYYRIMMYLYGSSCSIMCSTDAITMHIKDELSKI